MLRPCVAGDLRILHEFRKDPKEDKAGFLTHRTYMLLHPPHGHGLTSQMVGIHPHGIFDDISLILVAEIDPLLQLECPLPPIPPLCVPKFCASEGKAGCWTGYPQSRFPNWTRRQGVKGKIYAALKEYARTCTLYRIDVDKDGFFTDPGPFSDLLNLERKGRLGINLSAR